MHSLKILHLQRIIKFKQHIKTLLNKLNNLRYKLLKNRIYQSISKQFRLLFVLQNKNLLIYAFIQNFVYNILINYSLTNLNQLPINMQTLQYCIDARTKLGQLKSKQIPTKTKIMLIESLRFQLKNLYEFQTSNSLDGIKLDLSSTTLFTETKSLICKQEKQEQQTLIQQILKKQKIKIEIDQEIQTSQDDLNQINKIVQTKHIYNEELENKINVASRELQKQKIKQFKEEKQSKQARETKEKKQANHTKQEKQQKTSILQKVKSTPSLLKKIFG